MEPTLQRRVRCGEFELDPRAGELHKNGQGTVLQEQQLKVLLMLIEREGEIVTRDDIKKKLWPNDTVVEFDHSINNTIRNLRRALDDAADDPKYIGTVARRGYRLMVPVEWVAESSPDGSESGSPGESDPDPPAQAKLKVGGLTGKVVSHYRALEVIGGGGMGLVYRAEDLKLGRPVALKFLPEEVGDDPKARERFEREAHAVSSLNHPNICTIYDFDEHEGHLFIAMELLQGRTMRDHLADGRFRLRQPEGLGIAIQIASGLEAAHEKGIIHRDIKPANIFITEKNVAKILDFGVAKVLAIQSAESHSTNRGLGGAPENPQPGKGSRDVAPGPFSSTVSFSETSAAAAPARGTSLTLTGTELGTAGYMSPEQIRGEPLDARTDIFSFGLVLYEMATGQRAFSGETAAVVRDAILNNSPAPVRQLNSTLPARLVATIEKCLEKKRERRYQCAAELRRNLEDLKRGTETKIPRRVLVAWAVGILALVVLAVGLYVRRASHAPRPGSVSSSLQVHQLTESGKSSRVAATPDGSYVAYVKKEAGKYELRLLQVATERDVLLLPGAPQRINSLHFSRDGNFLYFLRVLDPAKDPYASGVFRIGTLGGPVTTLATDARTIDERCNSVTVSPDGKQIAYIAQTASESFIVAIDADGSNRRVLAKRAIALPFWFLEWSPSQDTLAAVANFEDSMALFRVDLPTGSMRNLGGTGWTIGQPAWSSDGSAIFAPAQDASSTIMQIWAFDARTGTHRALTSSSTWYYQWTLSATATGDLIANTFSADTNLWTTDHSGRLVAIPTLRSEGFVSAVWVDNRIVTGNRNEMAVHDPDGGNPTKLRNYSSLYRQLARCGPDHVVYWASDPKRKSHIARTDITTGASSALTDGHIDLQPTCTADGSTLVFVHCSDKGDHCALTRKSLDSGRSLELYQFDPADDISEDQSPSISPDGKSVLFPRYTKDGDPYEWAAIVPAAGGEVTKLRMPIPASQTIKFRWAADGKSILYSRNEVGVGNIWSVPLAGGAPKKITNFDSDQIIFAFDVSPENRLVISRGNWISDVVLIKNVREGSGQPPATAN
jgi:serine/threonine protein kinase/Tol biopolymer transport system component